MIRRLLIGLFCLGSCGILLTTCYMEYFDLDKLSDEVELRGDLLAPLVYGSMTMDDLSTLLDSTMYIGEDSEGLLYLAFTDTLLEQVADTAMPEKLVTKIYIDSDVADAPEWIGSGIGDTIPFYKSEYISFELEGDDRLDSVLVKGGSIIIDVASSFKHAGILTVSSNGILDMNRDTLTSVFHISEPDGNYDSTITIPSDGFTLITEEAGDSTFVVIHYKLELINSGNPVDPGDECSIITTFEDLSFHSAFGYIDSRNLVDEEGIVDIPFFGDYPDLVNIKFADPKINLFTSNSVGVPFEVTLEDVVATAEDGSEVVFEIWEGHPFHIPAPGLDEIGATVDTTIELNRENCNIDDLLGIAPTTLSYKVQGRTDPAVTGRDHFILDTSKFSLTMEFLLPLDLKTTGYALEDTLEFEIGENGVDTTIIKFAEVTLSTVNELPLDLETQVYMLNSSRVILDSVFSGQIPVLAASQVDQDGRLVSPSEETSSAIFPAVKLDRLKEVRYLLVRASLVTAELGDRFVKFYSDYTLDYEISMVANVRINSREL